MRGCRPLPHNPVNGYCTVAGDEGRRWPPVNAERVIFIITWLYIKSE